MEDRPIASDEHQQQITDRYLSSRSAYWAAQLTISGLLLTFFSSDALTAEGTPWLNYALVGVCIVSIWLLLINFSDVPRFYYELGSMTDADVGDPPAEDRQMARTPEAQKRLASEWVKDWGRRDIAAATQRRTAIQRREKWVSGLLVAETILVVIILLAEGLF